jgi:hypothetical protein
MMERLALARTAGSSVSIDFGECQYILVRKDGDTGGLCAVGSDGYLPITSDSSEQSTIAGGNLTKARVL